MKRLIKVLPKAEQEVIRWLRSGRGFCWELKDIRDPIRVTRKLADFRAPVADWGHHNPNFVDHLDIFQLHLDLVSQNFLGTGTSGRLEVGRVVMDFGEGRLIAGHSFGSFSPSFDGVQLTLGGDIFLSVE